MKNLFLNSTFSILGVILLLSSCTKKGNHEANLIAFDTINVAKVYHLDNDSTKPSCSLKIDYIYPNQFENADVLAKIQQELNFIFMEGDVYETLTPVDAVNKYVNDYITNYKEEVESQFGNWEESGETEDYFSFYKTLSSEILFNEANILSYQIKMMDYKGGANSSTLYQNIVFDLNTGNVIKEQDIFSPNYKKLLNTLLINKIVAQNKVQKPEDLLEFGYYGIEDLTSNGNFYVDNKGITYIYNQREIAAPSLGEIRIFISYNEIENLLSENSPISVLSGK
ncbi:RsiV family protein [Dysgonomonas sp. ZJ279]|uniref:RsiV family protein n=1 Tax=Dysgonomonas sp. ZJ279 TaxID=2709796 RepID=UPI0013EDB42B|nr:RsiV family protein [Dysgonomonas sp. ZJ279]